MQNLIYRIFGRFPINVVLIFLCPLTIVSADQNACHTNLKKILASVENDSQQLLDQYSKLLNECPDIPEIRYNYGVLLFNKKKFSESIVQFEAANKLREKNEYKLALASAFLSNNQLHSAKELYENVLSNNPREINAFLGIAAVYESQSKYKDALDYLNRAHSLDPTNLHTNYNLAVIYERLSQYDAAIASCEKAINLDSGYFPARFLLALTFRKAGRDQDFLKALKFAATMPNSSLEAKALYASELEKSGSLDEAEVALRRALSSTPTDTNLQEQLAVVLLKRNQEQNARTIVDQLLVLQPENPRYLVLDGWTHFKLGDLRRAEQSLLMAISKQPDHVFAFLALAEVNRQLGRRKEYDQYLETAFNLEPSLRQTYQDNKSWWQFW